MRSNPDGLRVHLNARWLLGFSRLLNPTSAWRGSSLGCITCTVSTCRIRQMHNRAEPTQLKEQELSYLKTRGSNWKVATWHFHNLFCRSAHGATVIVLCAAGIEHFVRDCIVRHSGGCDECQQSAGHHCATPRPQNHFVDTTETPALQPQQRNQ